MIARQATRATDHLPDWARGFVSAISDFFTGA
jgi:hypothetical protein